MCDAFISIIINNFNYEQFLYECIKSALDQEYKNFEVIVVDDGSTDGSRDLIQTFGSRLIPIYQENSGQAAAFNAGFLASRGEIVCMLDADDTFLSIKLKTINDLFQQYNFGWCFDVVTTDINYNVPADIRVIRVDRRSEMVKGIFPSIPVPTSGLSFSRPLLNMILPMPVASGITLSDNFLKFSAIYLSEGIMVTSPLTFQRIHSSNLYTNVSNRQDLSSSIMIETGFQLAARHSGLRRLGRSLIIGGLVRSSLPITKIWSMIFKRFTISTVSRKGATILFAVVVLRRAYRRLRKAK